MTIAIESSNTEWLKKVLTERPEEIPLRGIFLFSFLISTINHCSLKLISSFNFNIIDTFLLRASSHTTHLAILFIIVFFFFM